VLILACWRRILDEFDDKSTNSYLYSYLTPGCRVLAVIDLDLEALNADIDVFGRCFWWWLVSWCSSQHVSRVLCYIISVLCVSTTFCVKMPTCQVDIYFCNVLVNDNKLQSATFRARCNCGISSESNTILTMHVICRPRVFTVFRINFELILPSTCTPYGIGIFHPQPLRVDLGNTVCNSHDKWSHERIGGLLTYMRYTNWRILCLLHFTTLRVLCASVVTTFG